MTRHRVRYPTPYRLGPLRLMTLRHCRGYIITDERGRIVWTTPHPVSGRPIPKLEPDARRALRVCAEIIAAR